MEDGGGQLVTTARLLQLQLLDAASGHKTVTAE